MELPRRVEVISHDPAVRVQRFGNEGTGAQSFLDYQWKPGVTYRFLLRAQPGDGHATYAAWFFVPEDGQWKQLAVFRRRTDKPELRGLYSFVEDFRRDGQSPEERRAAVFANGFCRTPGQQWIALTQVTFTADNTPLNNINAAAVGNGFRLATGGQTMQQSALRSVLRRTPVELPPEPAP